MPHSDEEIICPNCGFHATENYCARCGQETHLHNETFWGLIMHFAGHYFHYDSKFWQTLKALWLSPGKLTLAYWNKQRMRYIPPISLYIFVSFVFFFVYTLFPSEKQLITFNSSKHTDSLARAVTVDTSSSIGKAAVHSLRQKLDSYDKADTTGEAESRKREAVLEAHKQEIQEQAVHMLPKVFFFMIPIMGLVLLLLFIKRKELTYVNHIIFALHYHSFWFSLMLLDLLYRFKSGAWILQVFTVIISAVYFIIMMRRVYNISNIRAVLYSMVVSVSYIIFLFIVSIGLAVLLMHEYL